MKSYSNDIATPGQLAESEATAARRFKQLSTHMMINMGLGFLNLILLITLVINGILNSV
jgi:hypothetical protein